jgi:hypothetical protein
MKKWCKAIEMLTAHAVSLLHAALSGWSEVGTPNKF